MHNSVNMNYKQENAYVTERPPHFVYRSIPFRSSAAALLPIMRRNMRTFERVLRNVIITEWNSVACITVDHHSD